jgi:protein SCO1/2
MARWAFGQGALVAGVLLLSACAEAQAGFPHAYEQVAQTELPSSVLEMAGGKLITARSFPGRWVWLYFGYTNCPDVCPTTLSFLAEAHKRLTDPARVQVLFVSVDPARDTPEKLAKHTAFFDPSFVGATGTRQSLDKLTAGVGARYELGVATRPGGSYTVNHTNIIYVLDPSGRLAARYAPEGNPSAIANDFNDLSTRLANR